MNERPERPALPHTEVVVDELRPCDIDPGHGPAMYDAKTVFGPWAWLCPACFKNHGVGLGLGRGQKLKLRVRP